MKKVILFVLAVSILASCSTTNEVMSNKLFQKRKYQKGWHVNSTKKVDRVKKSEITEYEENLVAQNEEQEEKTTHTKEQPKTSNDQVDHFYEDDQQTDPNYFVDEEKSEELKIELISQTKESSYLLNSNENKIEIEQEIKKETTTEKSNNSSDHSMLLMVILCLFLPPVAVGLLRGWSSQEFLISLLLFVIGWGLFVVTPFATLATLAGIVYAFLILFDII